MNWDDLWMYVCVVAVLGVATIATTALCAEHKVRGYYLTHGANSSGSAVCVYSNWNWHADERAFCTDDMEKALRFVKAANETVK